MSIEEPLNIQLNKDEKERIIAEEIFREQIRAQLATANSPKKLYQRLWASRNSAFSLWLLSSIVLAVISWSYAQWESVHRTQNRAELDYMELVNQAAFTLSELQEAIIEHRSIVEQYLQGNIRKIGRLHYRVSDRGG